MININSLNPLELAYIGDAIYELYIREYNINRNIRKVNNLQNEAVKLVNANYQAKAIKYLIDNNILTNEEIEIYKRARNYKINSKAKHTDLFTYRYATGLEALIGYLYLSKNTDRMKYIIMKILEEVTC